MPNLSRIYLCTQEIYKTNVSNTFSFTKSPFEFVFVTLQSKNWCEMFVFKLAGIQNALSTKCYKLNMFDIHCYT